MTYKTWITEIKNNQQRVSLLFLKSEEDHIDLQCIQTNSAIT